MKVLCILGESGTGKTHLAHLLNRGDEFQMIKSYTTRRPRGVYDEDDNLVLIDETEVDHIFVDESQVDSIFDSYDVVASTQINENWYWTTRNQFDEDKVNLYVIDPVGYEELLLTGWDIFLVFMKNKNPVRPNQVNIPVGIMDHVDYVFDNNNHDKTFDKIADLLSILREEKGWIR